ncbi:hypothetical protein [Roseibium aggregatum]|uniref:hypothetical protein n=1 Tax=Roseibium aggregatum TaxID=187304 RepID=UPI003A9882C3
MSELYSEKGPQVMDMAKRIADRGPQNFETDTDFIKAYGQEAADMVMHGDLLVALWAYGYSAQPLKFVPGAAGTSPVGLKIMQISER